uniref:Uncharacterized protein n=1 Tax=Candidatus Kentrum sp. LFY TaxID=2126342 RepID=A0A450WG84_9GAMM|nr:MAG: hypothetical protein BECKLFY1418C_GA0070996_10203 [Candidatus Kentron sp. LFY]
MKFWTGTRVEKARSDARNALRVIEELFFENSVNNSESSINDREQWAWGQFLDEKKSEQIGVYGTSATIQILAKSTYSGHDKVRNGAEFLKEKCGSHYEIIYKLSYLAKAISTLEKGNSCQTIYKILG